MMRLIICLTALPFLVTSTSGLAYAANTTVHRTDTIAGPQKPKEPLTLTEADRRRVLTAVTPLDTEDKLPANFDPVAGEAVPSQKKLPLHPLPRPLINQIPKLKEYYYAKLPTRILIVNPTKKKVVEVIPR